MPPSFKKGEAPWELDGSTPPAPPKSFKVGSAPWETAAPPPPQAPEAERFNAGESAIEGAGDALTLGYLPEMQAGVAKLLSPQEKYADLLKAMRARNKAIQAEDPGTYLGGNVGGAVVQGIATSPLTAITKGGTAVKILKAGLQGAAQAGLTNPGETDNQIQSRWEQAKQGAALGAGGQTLGSLLSTFKTGIDKSRQGLALTIAGARKAHRADIAKFKSGDAIEQFMQKEGMMKPGQNFETVLDKSNTIVEQTGERIGNLYSTVTEDLGKVAQSSPEIAKELADSKLTARGVAAKALRAAKQELRGNAEGKRALAQLKSELKNLAALDQRSVDISTKKVPTLDIDYVTGKRVMRDVTTKTPVVPETPFSEILKYRQTLDDNIRWNKTFNESKTAQKAMKVARNSIKDSLDQRMADVERAAKKAGGEAPARVAELKALNARYKVAKNVQTIAADRAANEASKLKLGGLVGVAGGGSVFVGDMVRGKDPVTAARDAIAVGAGISGLRKYGPALGYQGLRGAGKALGMKVPPSTYITPWTLMNRGQQEE